MEQESDMARDDWVYPNIPKELDEAVNKKLKEDSEMKKKGIWKSNDYYTYLARKYIEEV